MRMSRLKKGKRGKPLFALNSSRLLQNRKSAKKCRQKKKAMFSVLQNDVTGLYDENKVLKDKVIPILFLITYSYVL